MLFFKHLYKSYEKKLFNNVEIWRTNNNWYKNLKYSFSLKYLFIGTSFFKKCLFHSCHFPMGWADKTPYIYFYTYEWISLFVNIKLHCFFRISALIQLCSRFLWFDLSWAIWCDRFDFQKLVKALYLHNLPSNPTFDIRDIRQVGKQPEQRPRT